MLGVSLSPGTALAIEVAASFMRSLAFVVPNDLGVQDAGYVAMLAAFGVPDAATAGAAFIVLKRAKELAWMALGYLLLLLGGSRSLLGSGPGSRSRSRSRSRSGSGERVVASPHRGRAHTPSQLPINQ